MTNIAIENGPVEIVDVPMKNGDFPVRYVTNYQRVLEVVTGIGIPGLVHVDVTDGKRNTMLWMGKSTISTGSFSIANC